MHRYTQEQKQFIIDNNYGKYAKELAEMFNRKFNTTITEKEIKYFIMYCNGHGIVCRLWK